MCLTYETPQKNNVTRTIKLKRYDSNISSHLRLRSAPGSSRGNNRSNKNEQRQQAFKSAYQSNRIQLWDRCRQTGCIFSFVGLALCIVGIVSLCMGTEFSADPVTVPLVFGGASLAVGLSYLVVYLVTRKQIKD